MKKKLVMLSIILLSACVNANAEKISGEYSNSCAPWDGRSISIRLDLKNQQDIFIDIWRYGIQKLASGSNISLKAHGSDTTDGRFRSCDKGTPNCTHIDMKLSKIKYLENQQIEGMFEFKQKTYKFIAPFKNKGQGMCG